MKSYKTLIFVALLVVIGNNAFSQINGINYQAVAVDEQGKEIAGMDLRGNIIHNKAINVRFSILLGSSTGTILYQETHSTNTDPHGLFTLVIGQGVTTSQGTVNSIVDIDWSTQNHYLKVEIDFKQSGGYKLMGIQQLLAVPYSYYALKSGNPPQELTLTGNELSISNGNTITLPVGSYTAGEGINITGNTITNTAPNQLQVLSISNDTIFLTNGGFVKLPPVGSNISYTDLLNKPTNLSQFINDVGFIANESDPNFQASAAFGISLTNIANWNSSFSWGNHAGLYRPIFYVPDWSEITGKPILFDGTWASLSGKPLFATVSTSGNYNDLLNKPMLFSGSYSDLTNKPVLFDGTWNSLNGKPTTIAEYGITDAFNGDYNNLSNKPLLFSGSYTDLSNKPSLFSGNFSDLTGKPTTLLGYGITDAMSTSHSAYGITSADITNWTVAYNWGNHATQGYLKSYTETDPIFSAWNKSNGISITSSQVSDFETSVTNNAAVLANTAKNSYPTADATKLAGIEIGAEVNVNADWNATSGDGQILNKPTTIAGYGITDAVSVSSLQNGTLIYNAATGSSNAYIVNITPAISAYTVGMTVNFKANFDNTGASTININGIGAKVIKKSINNDLEADDIKIGQMVSVIYDGTNFQLLASSMNSSTSLHGMSFINTIGSNIFTVPKGVSSLKIHMVAGGGGGNYVSTVIYTGGGGAYFGGTISVTPGENITIIIGSGGAIGTAGGASQILDSNSNLLLNLNGGGTGYPSWARGGIGSINSLRVRGTINYGQDGSSNGETDSALKKISSGGGVSSPFSILTYSHDTYNVYIVTPFKYGDNLYGNGGRVNPLTGGNSGCCIIEW